MPLIKYDTLLWLIIFIGGLTVFLTAFVFKDAGLASALGGGGAAGGLLKKWEQYRANATDSAAG